MKKNEAISILATSQRPRESKDRARYDEAVKMAIDALNKSEPDTTTHDSIHAETGKNDGDGTSGDCISRHGAIDHLRSIIDATDTKDRYNEGFADGLEFCISHMATMPSAQPDIIRCKDCKWFRRWVNTDVEFCDLTENTVFVDDFCSRGERKE